MTEKVTVVSPQGDRRVVSAKAARVIYTQRGWQVEEEQHDPGANPQPPVTRRADPDPTLARRADPHPEPDPDRPLAPAHPDPHLTRPAGNATRNEWVAYARALGVEIERDATRKEIKARLLDLQGD